MDGYAEVVSLTHPNHAVIDHDSLHYLVTAIVLLLISVPFIFCVKNIHIKLRGSTSTKLPSLPDLILNELNLGLIVHWALSGATHTTTLGAPKVQPWYYLTLALYNVGARVFTDLLALQLLRQVDTCSLESIVEHMRRFLLPVSATSSHWTFGRTVSSSHSQRRLRIRRALPVLITAFISDISEIVVHTYFFEFKY